ncbi:hypothetical protein [Actibacterium sp. D379-3]
MAKGRGRQPRATSPAARAKMPPAAPARDAGDGDGGAVVKDGIESHFVDLAFAEADAISARQNFEDVWGQLFPTESLQNYPLIFMPFRGGV